MKYSVLLFGVLLTAFGGVWGQEKINGLSFVASDGPAFPIHAQSVLGVNANWTALMPFAIMKHQKDTAIFHHPSRQWFGETEGGVKQYHKVLKAAGIRSMLKPQIWLRDGSFTGHIKMESQAQWLAFEAQYRTFILKYAKLAAQENIPIFCIGTELKDFVKARPAFWVALIAEIRSFYTGKLTYAANWDEYEQTPFWGQLDFIGIDAYFPLLPDKDPTEAQLLAAWAPHFSNIKNMALACNKKVLFTEYGYRSVAYVGAKPWVIDKNKMPVNLEAQSRAIRAIVHTFWGEDWFLGGFIWKWFMDLERVGGDKNNRYTPQNKPGAKALKAAYGAYLN